MIFSEGHKKIEFSIVDYEFPLQKGMDSYDANWLTVKINYTDDTNTFTYIDNCLLTNELENIVNCIESVIEGKETGIMSNFIEPYLKLSLTKINALYALQIRFVYDSENWKEIYVTQGMSADELNDLYQELGCLSNKFPYRNTD